MFRLKQKHAPNKRDSSLPLIDGQKLLAEQSLLRGLVGSSGCALLVCWVWALISMVTGKVFPWFSIVIGMVIGMSMQRCGRGLDWRFPSAAMLIALTSSYLGNLLIGVLETGRYIDAEFTSVIAGLSGDTISNFFRYIISPIDHIYAFSAAALAAFFANRRLKRNEVLGVRKARRYAD